MFAEYLASNGWLTVESENELAGWDGAAHWTGMVVAAACGDLDPLDLQLAEDHLAWLRAQVEHMESVVDALRAVLVASME